MTGEEEDARDPDHFAIKRIAASYHWFSENSNGRFLISRTSEGADRRQRSANGSSVIHTRLFYRKRENSWKSAIRLRAERSSLSRRADERGVI